MLRFAQRLLAVASLVVMTAALPDDPPREQASPSGGSRGLRNSPSRLATLARLKRVDTIRAVFLDAVNRRAEAIEQAATEEDRSRALADDPRPGIARALLNTANESPGDPAALEAARFLASSAPDLPEAEAARRLLLEHHADNPALAGLLARLVDVHTPASEALLRKVAADQPDLEIRARASLALGNHLLSRVEAGESRDAAADRAEARALFRRVEALGARFGSRAGTMADSARAARARLDGLTIGALAPDAPGDHLAG